MGLTAVLQPYTWPGASLLGMVLGCSWANTESCLATPDTPGRTAVRPYRLADWQLG